MYWNWGNKKFYKFEELDITDQSILATRQCLSPDEFSFFHFDKQDLMLRKDVVVQFTSACVSSLFIFAADVWVVRKSKSFKTKGPLQQILVSALLATPIVIFNYYMVNSKYQELKKHLVFKYLVDSNFDKIY